MHKKYKNEAHLKLLVLVLLPNLLNCLSLALQTWTKS